MAISKKFPIAEIFGPTIQGEGIDQGRPCYFIRTGGCDFKCEWCDTPHAVLAENVRHLPRQSEDEILEALSLLPRGPGMVVISGGNPAMHDLGGLCSRLHRLGYTTSVETQGTRFKPWLRDVTRLCISPKPPSSGMTYTDDQYVEFLRQVLDGREYENAWTGAVFIKVVVFDLTDYEWAVRLFQKTQDWTGGVGLPFFVSAGNDAGKTVGNPSREDNRSLEQVRADLLSKFLWLTNRVMVDERWWGLVQVQAQQHVLAWGNKQGV